MTTPKKLHVRKDDTVVIISGTDKGKKGKVLSASPKTGRVIVEGANMVTKHQKPRNAGAPGGIIHKEAAIAASKVMLLCDKCNKPRRLAHKFLEDGTKIRVCTKCGTSFDN